MGNRHHPLKSKRDKLQPSSTQCGQLALGQKLLIAALMLQYAGTQATVGTPFLPLLVGVVLLVYFIGMMHIARGFRWSGLRTLLSLVVMIIPVVNLIALWRLNSQVTDTLRRAGYHVGLLGASKPIGG